MLIGFSDKQINCKENKTSFGFRKLKLTYTGLFYNFQGISFCWTRLLEGLQLQEMIYNMHPIL